jgi:NhaA family Na+:H+ antiporter
MTYTADVGSRFGLLRRFLRAEASGGVLLLLATISALVLANSPWGTSYAEFWETELAIGVGRFELSESLLHWINDGLMAVFFFLIGLEIKRELLVGELASPRRAMLPAAAAGGVLLPAAIYLAVNWGGTGMHGWGIPMATDPAFALGLMALLGSRAPIALRVFLTALAIVDDIAAVLVIALFYTDDLSLSALGGAAAVLVVLIAANRGGIRRSSVYGVLGVGLWLAFLQSGVHTTIAGVLLAMTIPARTRIIPRSSWRGARPSLTT